MKFSHPVQAKKAVRAKKKTEPPLSSNRVLGSWRGRAKATGLMRYPVRFLLRGQRKGPMAVILVTRVDGEERRSPRVTIVH